MFVIAVSFIAGASCSSRITFQNVASAVIGFGIIKRIGKNDECDNPTIVNDEKRHQYGNCI